MSQRILLPFLGLLCIVGVFSACQNVPKYKKSNGKFDEWGSYEGKNFKPSSGTITATDLKANTVTITRGTNSRVFPVTPQTRIMHEGTDITLAQLPLNEAVKYTLAGDGTQLLTIWYGHGVAQLHGGPQHKSQSSQNTYFH
jgi:hypothetical protein